VWRGYMQVYNMKQAQADIESVYSMGLFDDVNILPSPAEDATPDAPKVTPSCSCYITHAFFYLCWPVKIKESADSRPSRCETYLPYVAGCCRWT
jgi:hypothetical protein